MIVFEEDYCVIDIIEIVFEVYVLVWLMIIFELVNLSLMKESVEFLIVFFFLVGCDGFVVIVNVIYLLVE